MMTRLAGVLQNLLDFSNVLNVSIAASWLVLAVLVLRFVLKKAPKWVFVALWGIVALRLLMPFSIESTFSLLPSPHTVSRELLQTQGVQLHAPAYLELVTNPAFPSPVTMELGKSIGSLQWDLVEMTFLWLGGTACMLVYAAVSWWRLRNRVRTAVRVRDNLFRSAYVQSPFVLGVFRPKIYLPCGLEGMELEHVVAHEQAHICRKDHWWKLLGFLLLAIHWFNPLLWLAYVLLCRDMELACDEAVIRELDREQRADYSQALLNCSVHRYAVAACPLAFGEVGVKTRIKSVLHYKKPRFWIVVIALILCMMLAVCFLTDPVGSSIELESSMLYYKNIIPLAEAQETMMAIHCPPVPESSSGAILIGMTEGAQLAKYLNQWDWKPCNAPRPYSLPSPGSVEFIIGDELRLTVHQRKDGYLRRYAVVQYGEEQQYYLIDRHDYPDAVALVMAPADPAQSTLTEAKPQSGYFLTIGTENVAELRVCVADAGDVIRKNDGSVFDKDEQIRLDCLTGLADLRGLELTALDPDGAILWAASVPDGPENEGVTGLVQESWNLSYLG